MEIVSKHPVFTEGKQMSGCCLRCQVTTSPEIFPCKNNICILLLFMSCHVVMSPCTLSRNGIMYKPGASFYDEAEDKTLVCCSGNIYASLGR